MADDLQVGVDRPTRHPSTYPAVWSTDSDRAADDRRVLRQAGLVPAHERRMLVAAKRAFDITVAVLALTLLLPVFLVVAVAVRSTSAGPAFFGHERIGRGGTRFRCWKFRTMQVDAAERLAHLLATDPDARAEWQTSFKLTDDPRVTRLGAFLRRSSLDELPQFWNVLRGDMAVVGPRPIVEAETVNYGDDIAAYLALRPGVTGPWQAFGRCSLPYEDRVLLDRHYADGFDLILDLGIVMRTVGAVLRRVGAH